MWKAYLVVNKGKIFIDASIHYNTLILFINNRKENQAGDVIEIYHDGVLHEIGSIDEKTMKYIIDDKKVSNG